MAPRPEFESGSEPRQGSMIGHYTTGAQRTDIMKQYIRLSGDFTLHGQIRLVTLMFYVRAYSFGVK